MAGCVEGGAGWDGAAAKSASASAAVTKQWNFPFAIFHLSFFI
jgi:hypothetical protein